MWTLPKPYTQSRVICSSQEALPDVDPPRNPGNWRAASEAAERRALAEEYSASYPPWVRRYLAGEDPSAR